MRVDELFERHGEADIVATSQQIHDTFDQGCLDAAEAERVARSAIAASGQADSAQITVNVDPDASCARVYTNAYGSYEVTIFAP